MKTHHTFSLLTLLSAAALFHLHSIPAAAHSHKSAAHSHKSAAANSSSTDFIRISCKATLYPDLCYNSLAGYASAVQADPSRLARLAITVSLARARRTAKYLSRLSRTTDYGGDHRVAAALHDCSSVFGDAVDQILSSLRQMRHLGSASSGGELFLVRMSNVQTWMSAALTNEDTCTDGFEDVPDCTVKTDVTDRVVKVEEVSSNALALVNSYAAKVTGP